MIGIHLSFSLNNEAFCCKTSTSTEFIYQVKYVCLKIQKIKCIESWQLSFEARLLKEPENYYITNLTTKSWIIPQNQRLFEINDAYSTTFAPEFSMIALILQNKSQGQKNNSVYGFGLYGLKECYAVLNSYRVPNIDFKLDLTTGEENILRPWLSLFGNDSNFEDNSLIIDKKKYLANYPFIPLDMLNLQSHCNEALRPKSMANVKIRLEFGQDNEVLRLLLFSKSVENIQVDNQRAVY